MSSILHFGLREQLDSGGLEHAILQFDFNNFCLTKYIDASQIFSVSFGEIKQSQTDGTQVIVSYSNPNIPPVSKYIPFNMQELEDFCSVLTVIHDNMHEILDNSSCNIKTLCRTLQPKICLRKCIVTQKSFKRKGKPSRISKFVKKKPTLQAARSVGFIVLTERSLFCFEDEKSIIPICSYPVKSIEVKKSNSDSTLINISCCGDKAVFHIVNEGDEQTLIYNAFQKARIITSQECDEILPMVNELQDLFEGTFNSENEDNVKLLQRLWDASNLGLPDDSGGEPHEFKLKTNRWKDLGFQRDDPISDLRATGLLGLQNLVYFAEQHPGLFLSMARDQQQSSEMEYPFATAGINITYLMIQLLGLRKPRTWYPTVDAHPLFFYNIHAWEELYTIIFRLFDQKWNQMLVGYMGFQKVIDTTREDVGGLLRHKNPMGEDVPFIFEMLGILLNDLENFKTDGQKKQEKAIHNFKEPQTPKQTTNTSPSSSPIKEEKEIIIINEEEEEEDTLKIQKEDEKNPLALDNLPPSDDNLSSAQNSTLNRVSFASLPSPSWRVSNPASNSGGRKTVLGRRSDE